MLKNYKKVKSGMLFIQILVLSLSSILSFSVNAESNDFSQLLTQITQKKYKAKTAAIIQLTKADIPDKVRILNALLEGEIFYRKSDKTVFYLRKEEGAYLLENVLSSEKIKIEKKRGYKKVTINNKLRRLLRASIAELQLGHIDVDIRKAAVKAFMKNLSADNIAILEKYNQQETSPDVKELFELAITIGELRSDDEKVVLAAISRLDGKLEPMVRNTLTELVDDHESKKVKREAEKSLRLISTKVDLYGKLETLYFGISLGSVLVLAGIGLAITFGVMGVINMAHGELIMLGAYTTYVIQLLMPNSIGLSILVAIPAAFFVAGLVGVVMERTVIRHLYGRPLETLLATFGISLILQQAVRSIFSPLNRTVITPEWMSGSLEINSVLSLTWNRLYIIAFCLLVFFALMAAMKKTSLGLQVRAVSQNRQMARAMGVRSSWVDAMTFGLGAGIAGVAGVALSLLTNVGPNLGQAYIIDSFLVVVFGGVGNLWGTLVAGMSLGVVNKMLEPWAGAVLAKILVLVFIILFIQKRPRGLFPQRGRAAEN